AGAEAFQGVVHACVELDARRETAGGEARARVIVTRSLDHLPAGEGQVVPEQVGRVEQEPEAAVVRREGVAGGKVDAVRPEGAHVLVGVDDVDNLPGGRAALDQAAVLRGAAVVAARDDHRRGDGADVLRQGHRPVAPGGGG